MLKPLVNFQVQIEPEDKPVVNKLSRALGAVQTFLRGPRCLEEVGDAIASNAFKLCNNHNSDTRKAKFEHGEYLKRCAAADAASEELPTPPPAKTSKVGSVAAIIRSRITEEVDEPVRSALHTPATGQTRSYRCTGAQLPHNMY